MVIGQMQLDYSCRFPFSCRVSLHVFKHVSVSDIAIHKFSDCKVSNFRWRKLVYGVEVVTLPDSDDLDDDTRHLCEQFKKYHKTSCFKSIVKDLK